MLHVVHVGLRTVVLPGVGPSDAGLRHQIGCPLAADNMIGDVLRAAGHLATVGVQADAIGVFVDDGEVVEDLALLFAADLAAADARSPHGRLVVHDPGRLVQAVDVLLDVEIAGEPGEVVPVAELVLHVAPLGLAGGVKQRRGEVVGLQSQDVADGPVVDSLHDLALGQVVAPAEPGDDREIFLLRFFAGGQHGAHARRVDGHRLFAEDVLAGRHRRLEVRRAEVRRRGQEHHVDVGGQQLSDRRRSRRSNGPARTAILLGGTACWRFLKLAFSRSSKTSAMAINLTLESAARALRTAPDPRPPQPIRPIFKVSPPPHERCGPEPGCRPKRLPRRPRSTS